MAGSVVVAVRKAVIDGIRQALAVADPVEDIDVTFGFEGFGEGAHREQVYSTNARASHERTPLKEGRRFRNERMEFDVVAIVRMPGSSPEEAALRAMEIGQVIEEFIADHKGNELGIPGLNWIIVSAFRQNDGPDEVAGSSGSFCQNVYTLRYDARLT